MIGALGLQDMPECVKSLSWGPLSTPNQQAPAAAQHARHVVPQAAGSRCWRMWAVLKAACVDDVIHMFAGTANVCTPEPWRLALQSSLHATHSCSKWAAQCSRFRWCCNSFF